MASVSTRPHSVAFKSVYVCVVAAGRTHLGGQRSGRHVANLCTLLSVRDATAGDGSPSPGRCVCVTVTNCVLMILFTDHHPARERDSGEGYELLPVFPPAALLYGY